MHNSAWVHRFPRWPKHSSFHWFHWFKFNAWWRSKHLLFCGKHKVYLPLVILLTAVVRKQLDNIAVTKACGPDLIPARVLKETASEIAPILAEIFQSSLDSGKLSFAWKDTNVSCISKKGQRSNPENYKPISLTSLVCKVLEHIICSQVCAFFSSNSTISKFQHGFPKRTFLWDSVDFKGSWVVKGT